MRGCDEQALQIFIRFGTLANKLRIFEILSCTPFCRVKVVLCGEKTKHYKNCNLSPNLSKLIEFEVIVKNDEMHKILGFFYQQ